MKFVRALPYITGSTSGQGHEVPLLLKFLYEFWGYCVNGASALTTPGGLAITTPSTLPAGFLEGASVLSTGTDGVTVAGQTTFTSASGSFSYNHYLKYLVTWVPGSDSTDDSIYQIVGVPNANTLNVTAPTGGTPQAGTLVPAFTSRTGINWRIVDAVMASQLTFTNGQYLVLQTSPSSVNAGQPNSQVQLLVAGSAGFNNLSIVFSPLGSWSGSAFGADVSATITPASGGNLFTNSNTGVAGFISMVAAPDFLLMHAKSANSLGLGAILHVEAPIRLYPQANDLAPFTVLLDGLTHGADASSTAAGYGGGFEMIGHDGTTRKVRTLTRSLSGDGPFTGQSGVIGSAIDLRLSFSPQSKVILSEALLSMLGTAGQYCIARCKAKNIRFCSSNVPVNERVGDSGEYLHLGNGVCWPWDNTIMAVPLLAMGA